VEQRCPELQTIWRVCAFGKGRGDIDLVLLKGELVLDAAYAQAGAVLMFDEPTEYLVRQQVDDLENPMRA
jgi:hypothetical protein